MNTTIQTIEHCGRTYTVLSTSPTPGITTVDVQDDTGALIASCDVVREEAHAVCFGLPVMCPPATVMRDPVAAAAWLVGV